MAGVKGVRMILFVNDKGEIRDIDSTEDKSLKELEITGNNPFEGWSDARIRCYRVEVRDGEVVMMTPYVSSTILDHIDYLGHGTERVAENIINTQMALTETFEQAEKNGDQLTDAEIAIAEVYEEVVRLNDTIKEFLKKKGEQNG